MKKKTREQKNADIERNEYNHRRPAALRDEDRNMSFVQFSKKAMASHRQLIQKNPVAGVLLTFFIEKMNKSNAVVCSSRVMEEITGRSRGTVSRALKVLREDEWIQTIKIGNVNAHVVNAYAFWQSTATNKHYAMFAATVIASQAENEATFDEMAKIKTKSLPILEMSERGIISDEELPPPDQAEIDLN